MNGREFGEALERALQVRVAPHSDGVLALILESVRAALQSITPNAGPQQAGTNTGVTLGDMPAGSAGGLADRNMGDLVNTVSRLERECERLHAWEKWGREHAKPALESIVKSGFGKLYVGPEKWIDASAILAALPKDQDPQGGVR